MGRSALTSLAIALALCLQGCIAHGLAGIGSGSVSTETYNVPAAESDAKLLCADTACTGVPIERDFVAGHSRGIFWGVLTGEVVAMFASYSLFFSSIGGGDPSPGSIIIPGLVGGTLVWVILADLVTYAVSDDYGRHPEGMRLKVPVTADWRGHTVPLALTDVVPPGAKRPPASFSVAAITQGATPLTQPLVSETQRQPAQAPPGTLLQGAPDAAASTSRRFEHGMVAVLDLRSSTKDLTPEDVRYFGDVVRGATLKAAPRLEVMTRENLLVLLQASGKDLANCEGECEVDTGRRIGADLIVSGEMLKVGTHYKLTLRLHDTHEARLIGATVASGSTIDELDEATTKAALDLFAGARK
jgi:hypothetical protein